MRNRLIKLATIVFVFVLLCSVETLFAGQDKKLRILFTDVHAPLVNRMNTIVDQYAELNPDVEIVTDYVAWGGSLAKVAAMKAAGVPPDIIYAIPEQLWILQQEGWLIPLDDVIEKLGGDKFFMPGPLYIKVDNHYWAVPKGSSPLHVEYRKDLFDKKGLNEPRTWENLLAAAKALTEDLDGDGKIDRYGISLPLKREYTVGVYFLSFLWGNGGHVLDKNGKVVFNSPETIQTLRFLKELYKYAPPGVTDYSWMQLVETYAQGKVAMTIYSSGAPFAKALKVNETVANGTAYAPVPTRLQKQQPKGRWTTIGWSILKDCKYQATAKDFLLYWFEPQRLVQWYLADPMHQAPAEKPVIESKQFWENEVISKYKSIMEQYIEIGTTGGSVIDPIMEHPGIVQPNTNLINQRLIITDCVQEVVLGALSPEKAAEKAAKRMEELLLRKE